MEATAPFAPIHVHVLWRLAAPVTLVPPARLARPTCPSRPSHLPQSGGLSALDGSEAADARQDESILSRTRGVIGGYTQELGSRMLGSSELGNRMLASAQKAQGVLGNLGGATPSNIGGNLGGLLSSIIKKAEG